MLNNNEGATHQMWDDEGNRLHKIYIETSKKRSFPTCDNSMPQRPGSFITTVWLTIYQEPQILMFLLGAIGGLTAFRRGSGILWVTILMLLVFHFIVRVVETRAVRAFARKIDQKAVVRIDSSADGPTHTSWKDLGAGDIVLIQKGEEVPCDCVLLSTADKRGIGYFKNSYFDSLGLDPMRQSCRDTRNVRSMYQACRLGGYVSWESHPNPLCAEKVSSGGKTKFKALFKLKDFPRPCEIDIGNLIFKGERMVVTDWAFALCLFVGPEAYISRAGPDKSYTHYEGSVTSLLRNLTFLGIVLCLLSITFQFTLISYFATSTILWAQDNGLPGEGPSDLIKSSLLRYLYLVPIFSGVPWCTLRLIEVTLLNSRQKRAYEHEHLDDPIRGVNVVNPPPVGVLSDITHVFADATLFTTGSNYCCGFTLGTDSYGVKRKRLANPPNCCTVGEHASEFPEISWDVLARNVESCSAQGDDKLEWCDTSKLPPPNLRLESLNARKSKHQFSFGRTSVVPPSCLNSNLSQEVRDHLAKELLEPEMVVQLNKMYQATREDPSKAKFVFHFIKSIAFTSGLIMQQHASDVSDKLEFNVLSSLASYLGLTLTGRSATEIFANVSTLSQNDSRLDMIGAKRVKFQILAQSGKCLPNVSIIVGFVDGADDQAVLYATGEYLSLIPYLGVSAHSKQSLKKRILYQSEQGCRTIIAGYKALHPSEARGLEKCNREDNTLQVDVFGKLNKQLVKLIRNIRYLGIIHLRAHWDQEAFDQIPTRRPQRSRHYSAPRSSKCILISNALSEGESISLATASLSVQYVIYNVRQRWKSVISESGGGRRRLRGTQVKKEVVEILKDYAVFENKISASSTAKKKCLLLSNELIRLFTTLRYMNAIIVSLVDSADLTILHRVEPSLIDALIRVLKSSTFKAVDRVSICGIAKSPLTAAALASSDVLVGLRDTRWYLPVDKDMTFSDLALASKCHILVPHMTSLNQFSRIVAPSLAYRYEQVLLWAAHTHSLFVLPNILFDFRSMGSLSGFPIWNSMLIGIILLVTPLGYFRTMRMAESVKEPPAVYSSRRSHWSQIVINQFDAALCTFISFAIARLITLHSALPSTGKELMCFQNIIVTAMVFTSLTRYTLLEWRSYKHWDVESIPTRPRTFPLAGFITSLAAGALCLLLQKIEGFIEGINTAPGGLGIISITILCASIPTSLGIVFDCLTSQMFVSLKDLISAAFTRIESHISRTVMNNEQKKTMSVSSVEKKKLISLLEYRDQPTTRVRLPSAGRSVILTAPPMEADSGAEEEKSQRHLPTPVSDEASRDQKSHTRQTGDERAEAHTFKRPRTRSIEFSNEGTIMKLCTGPIDYRKKDLASEMIFDDVSLAAMSIGEEMLSSDFLGSDRETPVTPLEKTFDEDSASVMSATNNNVQALRSATAALLRRSTARIAQPFKRSAIDFVTQQMDWWKLEFADPKLETLYRYSCDLERDDLKNYYWLYFLLITAARTAIFIGRRLYVGEPSVVLYATFITQFVLNIGILALTFTNFIFDYFRPSMYVIGIVTTICGYIDRLNNMPLYSIWICHSTWLCVISRLWTRDACIISAIQVCTLCLSYYTMFVAHTDIVNEELGGAFSMFLLANDLGCFGFMVVVGIRLSLTRRQKFLMNYKCELSKVKKRDILTNMLPAFVVDMILMKGVNELGVPNGMTAICPGVVTVIFCDVYDFQNLVKLLEPTQLVSLLDTVFLYFDRLVDSFDVIKIETVFETYLTCSGLKRDGQGSDPQFTLRDTFAALDFALTQLQVVAGITYNVRTDLEATLHSRRQSGDVDPLASEMSHPETGKKFRRERLHVKIGMNTGTVTAGVVGGKKPQYALFGDTVNTASRMKLTGEKDHIHISDATYAYLKDDPSLTWLQQTMTVKGKGVMETHLLTRVDGISYPDFVDSEDEHWISMEELSLDSSSSGDEPPTQLLQGNQMTVSPQALGVDDRSSTLEQLGFADQQMKLTPPLQPPTRITAAVHRAAPAFASSGRRTSVRARLHRGPAFWRCNSPKALSVAFHSSGCPEREAGGSDQQSRATNNNLSVVTNPTTASENPFHDVYMNPKSTFVQRRQTWADMEQSKRQVSPHAEMQLPSSRQSARGEIESALDELAIEKAVQSQREGALLCREMLNPWVMRWRSRELEREYCQFIRNDATHLSYTLESLIIFLLMRGLTAICRTFTRYSSDILQIITRQPKNPVTNLVLTYWLSRCGELLLGFITLVFLHILKNRRVANGDCSNQNLSHMTSQLCGVLYTCSVLIFVLLPGWEFGDTEELALIASWTWSTDLVELTSLLIILHHNNGFKFYQLVVFDVGLCLLLLLYKKFVVRENLDTKLTVLVLPQIIMIMLLSAYYKESVDRLSWFIVNRSYANDDKAKEMLVDMLPKQVLEEFQSDQLKLAYYHNDITFLFADIVGFTNYSSGVTPEEVVNLLQRLFAAFDKDSTKFNLFKLCTIGDAYVAVSDPPTDRQTNYDPTPGLINVWDMTHAMLDQIRKIRQEVGVRELNMRIGCHLGSCVGGVIGSGRIRYDFWGMDVLIGNSMESNGKPGRINVSETWRRFVESHLPSGSFEFEFNKTVDVQGEAIDCFFATEQEHVLRDRV